MNIMNLYLSTPLIKDDAGFTINGISYDDLLDVPTDDLFAEVDLVTITGDGSHVYINTAD